MRWFREACPRNNALRLKKNYSWKRKSPAEPGFLLRWFHAASTSLPKIASSFMGVSGFPSLLPVIRPVLEQSEGRRREGKKKQKKWAINLGEEGWDGSANKLPCP
jgi:hypothetical protein